MGQLWSRDKCIPMGGSFSAQSADLHSIWAAYTGRQEFRCLGALTVSPEGYIYWLGKWKVAMCQFRGNILVASDVDPSDCKELVGLVKSVLEKNMECACADKQGMCQGTYLGPVITCMGFCIALGGAGGGLNHIQPTTLTDDWSLRLGPSLMSPKHAYKRYLSGIFIGALVNGTPWVRTWSGQIVSALAGLQTAVLSGYGRGDNMRGMHRALHRAFGTEPHFLQATVKAVYSISYQLPGKKCVVISHIQQWLRRNAHWEGGRYTSWTPKGCMELGAYEVVWNYDWQALDMVRRQSCSDAACVSPR